MRARALPWVQPCCTGNAATLTMKHAVQITTAAVTTTADGFVYDVFQVRHLHPVCSVILWCPTACRAAPRRPHGALVAPEHERPLWRASKAAC